MSSVAVVVVAAVNVDENEFDLLSEGQGLVDSSLWVGNGLSVYAGGSAVGLLGRLILGSSALEMCGGRELLPRSK